MAVELKVETTEEHLFILYPLGKTSMVFMKMANESHQLESDSYCGMEKSAHYGTEILGPQEDLKP